MATPKDRPGRLDIVARARSENAPWLSALSRCRREVGHAGRAGLAGIVSLFFEACQYLERSREPGRRLARPMEFSRTRNPSRPTRASETQGKRARFKENSDQPSSDPRGGKGVKNKGKYSVTYGFTELRGKPAGRGRDGRASRNQVVAALRCRAPVLLCRPCCEVPR